MLFMRHLDHLALKDLSEHPLNSSANPSTPTQLQRRSMVSMINLSHVQLREPVSPFCKMSTYSIGVPGSAPQQRGYVTKTWREMLLP